MPNHESIEERCQFETKRINVQTWKSQVVNSSAEKTFIKIVVEMLTPNVTKSLPDGWQDINTDAKAYEWINDRAKEGVFLTIQQLSTLDVIGFLFLYESPSSNNGIDLRLGYLLAEAVWGKGLGSELIQGLVKWCKRHPDIKSLSGGVEHENIGSIKVLQRNGFDLLEFEDSPDGVAFYERRFT